MYYSFGEHAKKSPEEVIAAAKKQKLSQDALDMATSPVKTLLKQGVKTAAGEKGQTVSDEQLIKAIVLKTLKEVGLLPRATLTQRIHNIIEERKPKEVHPLWRTHLHKR